MEELNIICAICMAGTGASNMGYGGQSPFSSSQYINKDSSHLSNFDSTVVSGTPPGPLPGLSGTKFNVDAAAGMYPGKGGGVLKRKIKNITKYYKRMKPGSRRIRHMKSALRRKTSHKRGRSLKRHSLSRRRSHRKQRGGGGYSQYQNNLPLTPSHQVAGVHLPASQLGQANPPPIIANGGNCNDNYNRYTNMGSPSPGH
jgi:hypothetical protein